VKAASMEKTNKTVTKPTLKRKVGYVDEGVSVTRAKLAQLKIGEKATVDKGEAGEAGPSTKEN
jgi:hypothetical protein